MRVERQGDGSARGGRDPARTGRQGTDAHWRGVDGMNLSVRSITRTRTSGTEDENEGEDGNDHEDEQN